MRYAVLMAFLFLLTSTSRAEEPTPEQAKRIEELKKQLGEKKAEIAKIEAELAKLDTAITWKLDSVGALPQLKGTYFSVIRVISPGQVLVVRANARGNNEGNPFLVKGVPTADVISGHPIELAGRFKVTGEFVLNDKAFKAYDGSSVWVVEAQKLAPNK